MSDYDRIGVVYQLGRSTPVGVKGTFNRANGLSRIPNHGSGTGLKVVVPKRLEPIRISSLTSMFALTRQLEFLFLRMFSVNVQMTWLFFNIIKI